MKPTTFHLQTATLAGGCFWCTEAIFKRLKGVESVIPGYTGGTTENPTYENIHYNNTNHTEAIQITFDPNIIPYEKLLDVFWATHDPTTFNRQGADVGSEYRSAIFYHSDEQKRSAEESKKHHEGKFKDSIVTEIVAYTKFYPAEEEHYNFSDKYPNSMYCRLVIDPKIQKLYKEFKDVVKP